MISKKIVISVLFTFTFLGVIFSQTSEKECKITFTNIRGEYQGKNLFFQIEKDKIKKISLNNQVISSNLKSELFELNLSELKLNQPFDVKIEYCENIPLPYKILNPEVKN